MKARFVEQTLQNFADSNDRSEKRKESVQYYFKIGL